MNDQAAAKSKALVSPVQSFALTPVGSPSIIPNPKFFCAYVVLSDNAKKITSICRCDFIGLLHINLLEYLAIYICKNNQIKLYIYNNIHPLVLLTKL